MSTRASVKPCACGGFVLANVEDPTKGVRAHQREQMHADWADREYPSMDPTAPTRRVDLSARVRVRPAHREVLVGLGYEL